MRFINLSTGISKWFRTRDDFFRELLWFIYCSFGGRLLLSVSISRYNMILGILWCFSLLLLLQVWFIESVATIASDCILNNIEIAIIFIPFIRTIVLLIIPSLLLGFELIDRKSIFVTFFIHEFAKFLQIQAFFLSNESHHLIFRSVRKELSFTLGKSYCLRNK